jgi:hypothetical protein
MAEMTTRRRMLKAGVAGLLAVGSRSARADVDNKASTYADHATGIRILPGAWRPHYYWEHIAWVSPSWPSQDYIWLDFPEAIFTEQGLLYLSHVNPQVQPVVYPNPPAVRWESVPNGIAFERMLPNRVSFGGKITRAADSVDLTLFIRNGGVLPLTRIRLQTCYFLRAIKEFAAFTADNKYVHVPERGWMPYDETRKLESSRGKYRLGWRGGPAIADRPMMATVSSQAERLVACTWQADTHSLVHNPGHPCMHADPKLGDVSPGESKTIHGKLMFFEGSLDAFSAAIREGRYDFSAELRG